MVGVANANFLKDFPNEKHFRIHMGTNISNVYQLVEALEVMNDETFNHHVTSKKNDFKEWVQNVIEDKKLAESLRNVKTKEFMAKKIKDRIKGIEKGTGDTKVVLSTQRLNKFGIIDFSIGVAVGIVIGILLCSIV